MAVTFSNTNKPLNPRGNDASPLAYNRAALYSGKALDFDGVNDSVSVPTNSAFNFGTENFTLSAYLKITPGGSFSQIFGTKGSTGPDSGYTLYYQYSLGKFLFSNANGSSSSEIYTADSFSEYEGQWIHIAAIRDSSDAKNGLLYINGIKAELASTMTIIDGDNTNPFTIGVATGPNHYGKQQISNVKVFNTALTPAQIADLYNNPEKIVPTGVDNTALKLWLPMMESAGTTAYDGSGNGNHGTISGATYVNGVGAAVAQTSVIDWNKGTNLVTYSEDFSNAAWTTGGASIISNQTTSPNGILNADKFIESAALGIHVVNNSSPITGTATSTASVFYKKGTRRYFSIKLQIGGSSYTQVFDSEGLVTGSNYSNGLTNVVTTIEDYGNGWGRFSIKGTSPSGVFTYAIFALSDSLNPTFDAGNFNPKYTGTGTDYGYFWGAQVNAGSVGPYIPTLSTTQPTPVLLPAGLTTGRDITGVNLFENVRKQGALNLDGNSWAEVHDNESLDISPAMTMEAWMNCDNISSTTYETIFAKPSGTTWAYPYAHYDLRVISANVQWWFEGTFYVATYNVSLSGWNHLLVTKNGASEILYINGLQVATHTGNVAISTSPYDLVLGANTDKDEKTSSQIAQPRIYNRALTASEVLRNYNSGKNTYTNS